MQRVPVRIELAAGFDRQHPLPFGASLAVRVDTRERNGPPLNADRVREPVADADIYHYQDEGVEELITQIIASNKI